MVSFFKDFTKPVTSILDDDFDCKDKVTMNVTGPYGVSVKAEDALDKSFKTKSAKLTAKYKHKSGLAVDKFAIDSNDTKAELSYSNFVPGLKLLYKGAPTFESVGLEYTDKLIATDLSFKPCKKSNAPALVDASLVAKQDAFAFGGSVKLSNLNLSDYTLGLSYTQGPAFAALTASSKFSAFNLGVNYKACPPATVACDLGKAGDAYTFTLGTSYNCNPKTTIKAVANLSLDMKVACIQKLDNKVSVAGSATFNAKNVEKAKYGVAVTMG